MLFNVWFASSYGDCYIIGERLEKEEAQIVIRARLKQARLALHPVVRLDDGWEIQEREDARLTSAISGRIYVRRHRERV